MDLGKADPWLTRKQELLKGECRKFKYHIQNYGQCTKATAENAGILFLTQHCAGFGDSNKSEFQRVCFSCLPISHKMLGIPLWVRNKSYGRRTKGSEVVKCLF